MPPSLLKEFILPIDVDTFVTEFWSNSAWYELFLKEKLLDINVELGEWSSNTDANRTRNVRSFHPSKVSFPGLPSHAEVSLAMA